MIASVRTGSFTSKVKTLHFTYTIVSLYFWCCMALVFHVGCKMNRLHVQSQGYREVPQCNKAGSCQEQLEPLHVWLWINFWPLCSEIFYHCQFFSTFTFSYMASMFIMDPELKKLGYLLSKTFLQINSRAGTLLSAFFTMTPLVFP